MGQTNSVFTSEELDEYELLTFLSREDVIRLWKHFKKLDPHSVGSDPDTRLSRQKLLRYKYLRCNPFADRIIAVFSSSEETHEHGEMNFDDFVLMHSVFHVDAPLTYKAQYAFRMFDFDGDGVLDKDDLVSILERIVGLEHFDSVEEEINDMAQDCIEEADIEGDKVIGLEEFINVLSKTPDFLETFKMDIF